MNRRSFIQVSMGSLLAIAGFSRFAWGTEADESESLDVRDLVIWAPFEAFLPEDQTHHLHNPDEGTKTGILKAEDILKGEAITFPFWHGHGGQTHMFTVTPENLTSLKAGAPVVIYVPTTVVGGHYHMVVIDPNHVA